MYVSLPEKSIAVSKVFNTLDQAISQFQTVSGMDCFFGCGQCCTKPDIEASILEFIPLAIQHYEEGNAEQMYELLSADTDDPVCINFKSHANQEDRGRCTQYTNRGLICRLFGYSARVDKYGKNELVTCVRIKEESPEAYRKGAVHVKEGGEVPVMSNYYRQLQAIDFELANQRLPINEAMLESLKIVMAYYAYR
ncbi:MAG: YkgJ family cysteine cluster protein [Cyclobacteriaceae bacterium]